MNVSKVELLDDPTYIVWAYDNLKDHNITDEMYKEARRQLDEWNTEPYDDYEYIQEQTRDYLARELYCE